MLSQDIDAALAAIGKAPCLVGSDGVGVSGYDLLAAVGRSTAVLLSLGVAPGDRILCVSAKSSDALTLLLATLRTGALFTPIDLGVSRRHLEAVIDDAQPSILVAPQETLTRSGQKLRMSRVRTALSMEHDGRGTLSGLATAQQSARTSALVRPTDPALLAYDGSDTPRAIIFSHAALTRQADLARSVLMLVEGEVVAHALSTWAEPGALAFLLAALLSRTCVRGISDTGVASAALVDNADVLLAETPPASRGPRLRTVLVPARASHAPGAGVTAYLSLPEAGLVAVAESEGAFQVLAGMEARVEDGALVVSDKAIFSGYWRRKVDSESALRAGIGLLSALPARQDANGRLIVTPQA